jgi:hypothetical protein
MSTTKAIHGLRPKEYWCYSSTLEERRSPLFDTANFAFCQTVCLWHAWGGSSMNDTRLFASKQDFKGVVCVKIVNCLNRILTTFVPRRVTEQSISITIEEDNCISHNVVNRVWATFKGLLCNKRVCSDFVSKLLRRFLVF